MNKYRVLKSYPKHLINSGRLVTLNKSNMIYLKPEPQVNRLVLLGFLQQEIEFDVKDEPIKEIKVDKKYKTKKLEQE